MTENKKTKDPLSKIEVVREEIELEKPGPGLVTGKYKDTGDLAFIIFPSKNGPRSTFRMINEFMEEGSQHPAVEYSLSTPPAEKERIMNEHLALCKEELRETEEALLLLSVLREDKEDRLRYLAESVDGFLDLAYVAFTGAIRLVGATKAKKCWEAILDANDAKINGTLGEVITDPNTGKVLKPRGWKAPDLESILEEDLND